MSLGWGVSLGLSVPLGMGVECWAGFWGRGGSAWCGGYLGRGGGGRGCCCGLVSGGGGAGCWAMLPPKFGIF